MTDWQTAAFIDYVNAVDDLLEARYGITSDDAGLVLIAASQEAEETPEECAQEIAEKYGLVRIDVGAYDGRGDGNVVSG